MKTLSFLLLCLCIVLFRCIKTNPSSPSTTDVPSCERSDTTPLVKTYNLAYGSPHHAFICIQECNSGYVSAFENIGDFGVKQEITLIKTTIDGDTIWMQHYIGHELRSMVQTTDGGFLICGNTCFPDSDSIFVQSTHAWVLKTDNLGKQEWTYEGSQSYGYTLDAIETKSHTFIIKSRENNILNLSALNSNGQLLWSKHYPYALSEWGEDGSGGEEMLLTEENNLLVIGSFINPANNSDAFLLNLTLNGDTNWTQTFGSQNWDYATGIVKSSDNGFILIGCRDQTFLSGKYNVYSGGDVWAFKVDLNGNMLWSKSFGYSYFDHANWIESMGNGTYVIAAQCEYSYSDRNEPSLWILRINESGDSTNSILYRGHPFSNGTCIRSITNNICIVAGSDFGSSLLFRFQI